MVFFQPCGSWLQKTLLLSRLQWGRWLLSYAVALKTEISKPQSKILFIDHFVSEMENANKITHFTFNASPHTSPSVQKHWWFLCAVSHDLKFPNSIAIMLSCIPCFGPYFSYILVVRSEAGSGFRDPYDLQYQFLLLWLWISYASYHKSIFLLFWSVKFLCVFF